MTDPQNRTDRAGPRPRGSRLATAVRVVVWLDTFAVLMQAVAAGRILAGDDTAVAVHVVGAVAVALISLVLVVLAVVAWRRRAATARTAGAAALILLAVLGQAAAGDAGQLGMHLPLGLLIFGGLLWAGLIPPMVRP